MGYKEEYLKWASSPCLDPSLRAELEAMKDDEKAKESAFYAPLAFGTAGLRGVMGVGINRMNVHTVAQATQGLAQYIISSGEEACARGCAIAYDCRNNSEEFAEICACVLAGNGIKTYLFDSLRPTPELSFAIREYSLIAGINITASHNTKEYNGYKAYWEDGAQIPPPVADKVSEYINSIDPFTGIKSCGFKEAVADGRIVMLGAETDEKFYARILASSINPEAVKEAADDFKVVYTPFHGTGYREVPEVLSRLGFKNILCVPEQMKIDGNFPTVASPNPEYKEGFALAIELAKKNDVDLIIGTDPDADRVGIVVRNSEGEYVTLTGNQTGVLLSHYIITCLIKRGELTEGSTLITSIVSTAMVKPLCEKYGVTLDLCFTGFKFIAERMNLLVEEGKRFLLGFEESYGYLTGVHARDKDAVGASALIAEMAAYYHMKGKTLYDILGECYSLYGYYAEQTVNLVMLGIDGLEKMKALMESLRSETPRNIGGYEVSGFTDYLTGEVVSFADGNKSITPPHLCDSNVLEFRLACGSKVMIRPSGTEPKIKVYILASGETQEEATSAVQGLSAAVKTLNA